MPDTKPVLKVFGLPTMPREKLVALHTELAAAAVSLKKLDLKGEEDLLILFPTVQSISSEILIEYRDPEVYWRHNGEFAELASKLGNVVKRHVPDASFIQCQVVSADYDGRGEWTSDLSTTRKEVEAIHAAATELLPQFLKAAREKCYCEDNAADHKGACSYHNVLAQYQWAVDQGNVVLATEDQKEFQGLADTYVANSKRNSNLLEELKKKLGWNEQSKQAA